MRNLPRLVLDDQSSMQLARNKSLSRRMEKLQRPEDCSPTHAPESAAPNSSNDMRTRPPVPTATPAPRALHRRVLPCCDSDPTVSRPVIVRTPRLYREQQLRLGWCRLVLLQHRWQLLLWPRLISRHGRPWFQSFFNRLWPSNSPEASQCPFYQMGGPHRPGAP
jgi:hypothetical protein